MMTLLIESAEVNIFCTMKSLAKFHIASSAEDTALAPCRTPLTKNNDLTLQHHHPAANW